MEDEPVEEAEPGRAWGIGHVVAGVVIGMVASVVVAGLIFTLGDYEVDEVLPLSLIHI